MSPETAAASPAEPAVSPETAAASPAEPVEERSDETVSKPPRAKKIPTRREFHGDVYVDPYEWMRDKDDPEVIAYLEAQNTYAEAQTADLADLRTDVYGEIKARTRETDMSVPVRIGGYWYYGRSEEGRSYAIHCRCPIAGDDDWTPPEVSPDGPLKGEEIILDGNVEAEGHDFFALAANTVSDDGKWLAYGIDTISDERYTLRIKNLETGELLPDVIPGTAGNATWSKDAKYLFYLTVDEAWRPDTVWRHEVGSGSPDETGGDTQVFHEPDERFWVGFGSTHSSEYLVIVVDSKLTSEVFTLPMTDPTGEFTSVAGRTEGVEYHAEHARLDGEDYFVIVHNGEVDGVKANDFAVDADAGRRPVRAPDPDRAAAVVPDRGRRLFRRLPGALVPGGGAAAPGDRRSARPHRSARRRRLRPGDVRAGTVLGRSRREPGMEHPAPADRVRQLRRARRGARPRRRHRQDPARRTSS
ncbi:MAG: hypothetical protein QM703_02295 [Gemmatales bacterium]